MRRLRLLLLPAAAVVEIAVLVLCWVVAIFSPRWAMPIVHWAERTLPSVSWFLGKTAERGG